MSVSLTPSSSLGFKRPLTQLVKCTLIVANNNEQPVAFKVKTTAPKLYTVRPNSGRIEPKESVEVQVLLQAMKEEPPLNVKCKDKFLVQSTIITLEKESMNLHDLWGNLDGAEGQVHQQKLRVSYLPPVGEAVEEEDEGYNQSSMMEGKSQFDTVRQDPRQNGQSDGPANAADMFAPAPQPPIVRALSPPADYSNAQDTAPEYEPVPPPIDEPVPLPVPEPILRQATPPSPPIVPVHRPSPSPSPPIPVSVPFQSQSTSELESELRTKLNEAQTEIQRLRAMLASRSEADDAMSTTTMGLRHRNGPFSDTETVISSTETDFGTLVDQPIFHSDGISPQIAGAIALIVFLITYIFF